MPDPQESYPLDLDEMEAWVSAHASPGARVLEIGAGDGALTRRLAAAGFDVVGVDPHADTDDPLIRRESFETFGAEAGSTSAAGVFDVIFASVSLHHLHDLAAASAALNRLSHPDSVALVREFDRDLVGDDATLKWWFHQRHARESVEEPREHHHHPHPAEFEDFATMWRTQMDHHVHRWPAVLAMLHDAGFQTSAQWSSAYLFRWGLLEELRPLEERLIANGSIKSVGVRWVGRRPAER